MSAGFNDAKKLKDAIALAQGFKQGGKPQDTGGGKGKHLNHIINTQTATDTHPGRKNQDSSRIMKQDNCRVQKKPPPRPERTATGTPRVGLRNYPHAGAFTSHPRQTFSGKSLLGPAMDFLQRKDKVIEPKTPRKCSKISLSNSPAKLLTSPSRHHGPRIVSSNQTCEPFSCPDHSCGHTQG